MDRRELPVISAGEESYVDQLAAGLESSAARVFVYLWLRSREDDIKPVPATQTAIQIGTELSQKSVTDAIGVLEDRDLVEATTVTTSNPGRPPTAWTTTHPLFDVIDRAYDQHARHLLEQAQQVSDSELGALPSVSTSGQFEGAGSTSPAADQETITLGLNWHPNGLQLPLYAAQRNSCYSDRGLAIETLEYNGSRRTVEAVVSGAATVGISGAATVSRARASGLDVVPIATLFQRPMVVLYTVRQSFGEPFDAVEQLSGRRVGMPIPSEMSILGKMFLAQAGVLEKVEIVPVEGEEHDALRSGRVDAVTGIFADPQRLESNGAAVDVVPVAERYPIYGPSLITSEATLETKCEHITRFLAGTTAGWAAAKHSPQEAIEHVCRMTDRSPEQVREVFEQAAAEFGSTDEVAKHGWGWQTPDTWDRLETALDQTALLEV